MSSIIGFSSERFTLTVSESDIPPDLVHALTVISYLRPMTTLAGMGLTNFGSVRMLMVELGVILLSSKLPLMLMVLNFSSERTAPLLLIMKSVSKQFLDDSLVDRS